MGKAKQLRLLKKAAKLFPTTETPQRTRMTGAEILKMNPESKGPNGKPLNPNGYYIVDLRLPKNHYAELKRLYYAGGMQAVNAYMNQLADVSELAVLATADINNSL